MDVQEKEALQILQGAFWVNPDDHLQEFKTKYRKWLFHGNHPDTGGSGQNFDRVRQAYHVHANHLNGTQKQRPVVAESTNYYEFIADAIARGNYFAEFMAYTAAIWGIPFGNFYTDCQK